MFEVGLRVVRGRDWKWDDQDGGEGHAGTVVEIGKPPSTLPTAASNPADRTPDKTVIVQWDHGSRSNYRIGYQGAYDLSIFDNGATGVKHANIICDGCKRHGIFGMRWKCNHCPDYDLCSLCYMSDIHDISHTFQRFLTVNAAGVQVGAREGCTKIPLKGIFVGAKVARGPDWEWDAQDGGPGKIGRVTEIRGWDNDNARSVATVTWPLGNANVYRLGYKGCVDLCYVEAATAGTYYKEHLPLLGVPLVPLPSAEETNSSDNVPAKIYSSQALTFNVGDKVKVLLDVETLKQMQDGHGGWNPRMGDYIGKVGIVHRVTDKGDIRVQYEGCNNRWTFYPGALTKLDEKEIFAVGDYVKVKSDMNTVKHHQKGHGEWIDIMRITLGKTGKVIKVYSDGDLRVSFNMHTWTFNPLSVVLVPASEAKKQILQQQQQLQLLKPPEPERPPETVDPEVEKLLRDAARGESGVEAVKEFIRKNPKKIDARAGGPGGGNKTCLQVCAHQGQKELCRLLLNAGANILAIDEDGDTPLHYAAFGNQPEIIEFLIIRSAPVNAVNKGRCTALHVSVNKQHTECVKSLLKFNLDVNLQDAYGDTALHDAIGKDAVEIVDALCASNKIDYNLRNKRGFNVLQHAALKGNAHATRRLVEKAQPLVNSRKDDGFAALHLAALNGHREVAAILIAPNGGNAVVDLSNNRRQTPLHLAAAQGHWAIVELLVDRGANLFTVDEDGDNVLHIALAKLSNQPTTIPPNADMKYSPRIYKIWQILAKKGARVELACACFLVSMDRTGNLLEQSRNLKGRGPLDYLSSDPEARVLADTLRQFKYSVYTAQLDITEPVAPDNAAPSIYHISDADQGGRIRRQASGDEVRCEGCSGSSSRTREDGKTDDNGMLIDCNGCPHCGRAIPKTNRGNHSTADDEPISDLALTEGSLDDQEKEQNDKSKEKDKDLERLRYLETRVADLEEANMCSICMERRRNVAFLCGHGACGPCAAPLKTCHMCRNPITQKINLY